MDRSESAAVLVVIEQRLLLLGGDPLGVGVDHQHVVFGEGRRVEVAHRLGVSDVDPASRQHRDGPEGTDRPGDGVPGRGADTVSLSSLPSGSAAVDESTAVDESKSAHKRDRGRVIDVIPEVSGVWNRDRGRALRLDQATEEDLIVARKPSPRKTAPPASGPIARRLTSDQHRGDRTQCL